MNEKINETTAQARPVKFKSNAPWVLGLIALLLAIPNLMCQMLCKEAVSTLDSASADIKEVATAMDKVASNDAKALRDLGNTLDAASKGDLQKTAEAGRNSLKSTADTMKATADLAEMASNKNTNDSLKKSEDAKKSSGMEAFEDFMEGSFMLCLGMFILSFFGKSKLSAVTGGLIIAGAFILTGWSFMYLQILGCIEGILFLFSGIFSITNKNKVK